MKIRYGFRRAAALGCWFAFGSSLVAGVDNPGPEITTFSVGGGKARVQFAPGPSVNEYSIWSAPALGLPFTQDTSGVLTGFDWRGNAPAGGAFYQVRTRTLTDEELLVTTVLNRLAYGPTPDELERVRALGADAYIEEQLAAEKIVEDLGIELDEPPAPAPIQDANGWRKIVVSGAATKDNPRFYVYVEDRGKALVDDVRLVAGPVENDALPNLLKNGDFESLTNAPLSTPWEPTADFTNSIITIANKHSGNSALLIDARNGGVGGGDSIGQATTGITTGSTYTLSFWYLRSPNYLKPILRFSGATIDDTTTLTSEKADVAAFKTYFGRAANGYGSLKDVRRWHLMTAIRSKRQLLETTRQFLENHFVTQYSKTADFLAAYYDGDFAARAAAQIELRENLKWRTALLNPRVTFLDLLTISAQSPAMIIYLDTVNSRGNATFDNKGNFVSRNIANENYARELCELFCFGVDNGYDQNDIVELSRAWTGWTVGYKRRVNDDNPFGANLRDDPAVNSGGIDDHSLFWTLHYREGRHDERVKWCFYNDIKRDANQNVTSVGQPKTVPARFGPPWAGRSYGLKLNGGTGTNTIREGYQVLAHMADQPFTQEYLSVKLCRQFVHDGFRHGYDFADDEVTPEEKLVHDCMLAWENPPNGGPKGQLRDILRVIFRSELFRSQGGSLQKVKTPLEFGVSAVRALRALKPDGTYTSDAVGTEDLTDLLNDAGRMRLFDRAEPDGYPEDGPGWISAGTLAERLQFIERSLSKTKDSAAPSPTTDPVALLKLKRPEAVRNAEGVADFFVSILFPAEGTANLQAYRAAAVQFLNTTSGQVASPFSALATTSTDYDNRIRGMVSLLMTSQRFQEQ